jgi:hypothetical protein
MTVSDDDLNNLLNEELFARRVKALMLSNMGATIAQIAEECEVSSGTVRRDLDIAKRQYLSDNPDQRRAVHVSIIHDMRKANYPAMMRGDVDAANIILKGLKHEGNLFGLFPKVIEVPGIDTVQFANEAAALIERIAQIDPNGLKEITNGHTEPMDVETVEVRDESPTGATPFDAARPAVYDESGAEVIDNVGRWTASDGQVTDTPGDPAGLPGQAGEPDAGRPGTDPEPDDDDGWSNIGG